LTKTKVPTSLGFLIIPGLSDMEGGAEDPQELTNWRVRFHN
jgi:hypothetical protein